MLALIPVAGPFLALIGGIVGTLLIVPFSPFYGFTFSFLTMTPLLANQKLIGALILALSF